MAKYLIIVESPAKIKTLKKFLGPNYLFESSIGHIRDLPSKGFGIDIENDFEPTYETMPDKTEVIQKLQKAAKQCSMVYLSPDPDREGEAIAWHIAQILPEGTKAKRVSFNSITKDAVLAALEDPRNINIDLVNAQQARRLLDRIVGYKISPILFRRIQRRQEGGLSAGRVQSVALELVVIREKEIEAFKPIEYWNLAAILKAQDKERSFRAYLYSVNGQKVEKEAVEGKNQLLIGNKQAADAIIAKMKKTPYTVSHVEKKEKKRNPPPPFITSTLQQEASRHYGFSSARTMNIAQTLYEGIDLGNDGPEGLITYMRTDSTRIAPEALNEVRSFIKNHYGKDFLPAEPKFYTSKKSAQDAHEGIRPTSADLSPEKIERYLTRDQLMLYQLIWKRFVACQMTSAIYDTVSADIAGQDGIVVRATGSTIKFQGYLAVYQEKTDDDDGENESKILPNLTQGQTLLLEDLTSEQAFTRPPPRYTEASLVKELERSGIGRPSTYASIMNKIQSRDYTVKESGRLKPTELGRVISDLLEANFPKIMDIGFTAGMEDDLELVAEGKKEWKKLLSDFWSDFSPTLEAAEKSAFVPKIMTDIDCPKCGSKLQKVWFKSKYFYGCSRYPDCDYTAPIEELSFNKEDYAEGFDWEQKCPKCQSEMKLRHGKFGPFLGCVNYPTCKGIVNIPKKGEEILASHEDLPDCPAIDCPGKITARKSRYGKTFYSCSTFPECDVIANSIEQLAEKYPNHPRTAYISKKKTTKGKKASAKTSSTSKGEKATTKASKEAKQPKEKPAAKKKTAAAQPECELSQALAAIVGTNRLSRPQVVKKVWEYIKEHNLQDPKDKRTIVPDEKLSSVVGSENINMFKLPGLLSPHCKGS